MGSSGQIWAGNLTAESTRSRPHRSALVHPSLVITVPPVPRSTRSSGTRAQFWEVLKSAQTTTGRPRTWTGEACDKRQEAAQVEKDRGQDTNGPGLRQRGLGQWGSGAPLLEPAKEKAPRREWPTKGQAAGGHIRCRVSGACGAVTHDIRDSTLT